MEKLYSIQFVSKITGINAHTIRAWEKRYAAVTPARNDSGKRVYTQSDVDRLSKLAELVKLGNTISDIANLEIEKLDSLYNDYAKTRPVHNEPSYDDIKIDINSTLQNLVMALKHYKLDIISHELDKVKRALGPRDFALSILSPLLMEVGMLVDNGVITIAQEHSLSAILKFHVGHTLYKHVENKNKIDLNIAISTPTGELHEFGIMIGALLCAYYNINVFYLGPNMPADSLAEAAKQIGAKIVILGVSQVYHTEQHSLDDYLGELIAEVPEDMKIWVGGVSKLSTFLDQGRLEIVPTLSMLDQKLAQLTR
jgi:DNA-binding transcriptional MerR regulator/methylmalonyl-CoA mutase cobalamin-binding subunit